ncbi:MAG TPA: F0F1 ATP synthase subunit B [Chloroflexota bacterium]|nr:F0F1 ATP synthase subunit B [Chloroflexota bacterium]
MLLPVGTVLAGQYFLWWAAQVVAVAILVILALRWRPGFLHGRTITESMNAALDSREESIRIQLEAAERSRQEAARIREEAARQVADAREETRTMVERARTASEAIATEMHQRAEEEYRRIVGQARNEIEFERRQAEAALRRRAADIVVDAAGQVVGNFLEPASDRHLIDVSLSDLKDVR